MSLFGGGSKNSGPPVNRSSYASLNNASFTGRQLGMNDSSNRNNLSSLITNSIFVGIGYGLDKFASKTDRVGDLRNFKIQDYHPSTKYDFITTKSGITDGKIYMGGTRSSTNNLKYLRSTTKYLGYAASAYSLSLSYDEYVQGKIPGSIFLLDVGMTGVSYAGPYGAGISAFYFIGVRNTPDYFDHRVRDFNELRRVEIDNTRVRN